MDSTHGTTRPHDAIETPTATERPTKRVRLKATEDKSRSSLSDSPGEPEARSAAQAAREKMSTTSGDARQDAAGRKGTLQRVKRAEESQHSGWRHIGRVPGAPDPALTESDLAPRKPPQLTMDVCERIIDCQWDDTWMLQKCALVCKAWTPRCRYQMQRNVVLTQATLQATTQGIVTRVSAQS